MLGVLVGIVVVVVTYGIALIPAGLGLWWWIHRRHQQPKYLAGQLINTAASAPDPDAVHLYHQAIDIDPNGAGTLRAAGDWFYAHACWPDAADAYAGCLHVEKTAALEHNYALSLMNAGHVDEAIQELQGLASTYPQLGAIVTPELAGAFLLKGDAGQALAIAKQAPLQKHELDDGLQRALFARACAQYMAGQKAKAIADLERLYAVNPNFLRVLEVKDSMVKGTFHLDPPAQRPAWYPAEVEVREGPAVEQVEDGHADAMAVGTLSPDGLWSWDGTQWVQAIAPAGQPAAPPTPNQSLPIPLDARNARGAPEVPHVPVQVSADGKWWWNGTEWIPNRESL